MCTEYREKYAIKIDHINNLKQENDKLNDQLKLQKKQEQSDISLKQENVSLNKQIKDLSNKVSQLMIVNSDLKNSKTLEKIEHMFPSNSDLLNAEKSSSSDTIKRLKERIKKLTISNSEVNDENAKLRNQKTKIVMVKEKQDQKQQPSDKQKIFDGRIKSKQLRIELWNKTKELKDTQEALKNTKEELKSTNEILETTSKDLETTNNKFSERAQENDILYQGNDILSADKSEYLRILSKIKSELTVGSQVYENKCHNCSDDLRYYPTETWPCGHVYCLPCKESSKRVLSDRLICPKCFDIQWVNVPEFCI